MQSKNIKDTAQYDLLFNNSLMKCILLSINELWIVYKATKYFIPVFREILIPLYVLSIRICTVVFINKKHHLI